MGIDVDASASDLPPFDLLLLLPLTPLAALNSSIGTDIVLVVILSKNDSV